ncbi:MAG: hypothetical protein H6938_11055 [Burkholderiales bacterium]|nr:hypothetical protein [Burkholderiales bacterium]
MNNRLLILLIAAIGCYLLALSASAAYPQLKFSVADIKSPVFQTKSIEVQINGGQSGARELAIDIKEIAVQDYVLKELRVVCRAFQWNRHEIECTNGQLIARDLFASPLPMQFVATSSHLTVDLRPSGGEHWQFSIEWDAAFWHAALTVKAGKMTHLARWLPEMPDDENFPKLTGGKLHGKIKVNGDLKGVTSAGIDLSIDALAFSDAAGMHAGEDIALSVKSNIEHDARHQHWKWRGDVHWRQGAVFWQPLFFSGTDHALNVQGIFDGKTLALHDSRLVLAEIGTVKFSGVADWPDARVREFQLDAGNMALPALFDQVLKPFLADTVFAELEISGLGDFAVVIREGVLQEVNLTLEDVNIIDRRDRFAFHRIQAHIPWQAANTTIADISLLNGHLLRIPLGSVRVPLEIKDSHLYVPQLALPVLDGVLKLEDFSATHTDAGWRWGFGGKLTPVSMEALTEALQIQPMQGILSAYIPQVHYDGESVSVDGVLQVNVFDGSVVIHQLKLIEPMGLTPHLTADIAMRNLDLGLLTSAFSFGKVEGRVDIDVNQLELANWEPIHFDAHMFSSPGSYTRRISQAAIRNISALGGEGAVVAIQRSFLRFFEEFRYAEIGWRCALRFDVCYMGGIEPEPGSRYTLIKGGGIPAINVMGYNRNVGWQELISRLQRVTQENEPVIQ